jgi:formylglycine-generating enzyme required for sulfatase activity
MSNKLSNTTSRFSLRRSLLQASALGAGNLLLPNAINAAEVTTKPSESKAVTPTAVYRFDPTTDIIQAPNNPALWSQFRADLAAWREKSKQELKYDDTLYTKPEFQWGSSSYACYFLMMYDEKFYDPKSGRYTVDALLEEGQKEFGGYDSVVLWHAYPRIGVDQRNQYDFYRDMPGGLAGVRDVVNQFHQRGLKVYINYNPWDRATRREEKTDVDMLADMVVALDVDGIFLDTMKEGGAQFRAKLDTVRPGVILEGEGTPPTERLVDHQASWAQWFDDSEVPGVLRHKWYERRHMQHQTQRWNSDHSAELQTAWINGSGIMIWENVFGAWVPYSQRDRSFLRAMLPVQRRYTKLFSGEGWTPLVPVEIKNVYASLWEGNGQRLWTLVNRATQAVQGGMIKIDAQADQRYFDLITGRELKSVTRNGKVTIHLSIPARGLGGVLAIASSAVDADLHAFLAAQAATHARANYDTKRPYRPMQPREIALTTKLNAVPAGMIEARYNKWTKSLAIQMKARECGLYDTNVSDEQGYRYSYDFRTVEFTCPWVHHRYAIDETPVTNAQYYHFIKASAYRPAHPENYLKHWINGAPPAGKEDHPVVWVSPDDARAYAAWAGKRLPTEEEWQYAAQEGGGVEYPWHSGIRKGVCNLGETGDTKPVKAFPEGRAGNGIYDLVGNVWQWTDTESTEGRTRFIMIRGGSYFTPKKSSWYVDGGPRALSFTTKFLLMWPGLDRCGTVGFRCVVDLT